MNQKEQWFQRKHILNNYTKPNSIARPVVNAVYVRPQNSLAHEQGKLKVAWEHMKEGHEIITEAQRTQRFCDDSGFQKAIIDVVCLDCQGEEIEVVETHGDEERYKREGVTVVKV